MKKHIFLFDFDGTLVDSMPTYGSVMLRILDEHGIKYGTDILKIITPLGYTGTAEYFQKLGINKSVAELFSIMKKYMLHEYSENIPLKSGVKDTLMALKEEGADLNVLTASPHDTLDVCLKRCGIWDLFTHVWSCEDFKTTKANPEIYKSAAKLIGADVSDIIFIDDNINAVKTAKAAGMISYGIYDDSSCDAVEEMKSISDKYIYNFNELL